MLYEVLLDTFFLLKNSVSSLFIYAEGEESIDLYLQGTGFVFHAKRVKGPNEDMNEFLIWKNEHLKDAIRVCRVMAENG